jgi:hypothetical protein
MKGLKLQGLKAVGLKKRISNTSCDNAVRDVLIEKQWCQGFPMLDI